MLPLTLFALWGYVLRSVLFPTHYLSLQFFLFCGLVFYLMRSSVHLQMPLGWFLAWAWLFSVLHLVVPPNMRWSWYVFWAALIPALWAVVHPERSVIRFFAWTTITFVARFIVYAFYVWYWLNPFKSRLFPFNLVSGWFKASSPRWSPVNEAALCKHCKHFVAGSSLIMGSRLPVTRLMGCYRHYESVKDLNDSAMSDMQACAVCNLLLHSISEDRRQALIRYTEGEALRIRVWEERPLSPYTYVQLMRGRDALGARLLTHRASLFQRGKPGH